MDDLLIAGSDWAALDCVRAAVGWGNTVRVVRPGFDDHPEHDLSAKKVVLVADTPFGMSDGCETWLREDALPDQAGRVFLVAPGCQDDNVPGDAERIVLSEDPLQLFSSMKHLVDADSLPTEAEARLSALGVAQSFGGSLEIALREVADLDCNRVANSNGMLSQRWVRLPIWMPSLGMKWMLSLRTTDSTCVTIASAMTQLEPEEVEQEEELLESALGEVLNVVAGIVKSSLYDLGVSAIVRLPVHDGRADTRADAPPVGARYRIADELCVDGSAWLAPLETGRALSDELKPGLVLAEDVAIEGETLYEGDSLAPAAIEALRQDERAVQVYADESRLVGNPQQVEEVTVR